MSATALKAAATGNVANNGQPKTLAHLMTDPKIKAQMALALPKHMTADRLARIALTEIRKSTGPGEMQSGEFPRRRDAMRAARPGTG